MWPWMHTLATGTSMKAALGLHIIENGPSTKMVSLDKSIMSISTEYKMNFTLFGI